MSFRTFVWYDNELIWLLDLNYIIMIALLIQTIPFQQSYFSPEMLIRILQFTWLIWAPACMCRAHSHISNNKICYIRHKVRHLDPWGTISMHDLPISYCSCSLEGRKQCLYGKHWIVYGMQTIFFTDSKEKGVLFYRYIASMRHNKHIYTFHHRTK